MSFKVMSERCNQCLLDPENRIVSDRRAAQIMRECVTQDVPFYCHKSTMAGKEIACRGMHDASPCKNARFADWLKLPLAEFDPETLRPVDATRATTDRSLSPGTNKDSSNV